MQGSVSRCILGTHVSSIEQQVFQVLHVAVPTRLKADADVQLKIKQQ